jgi:hypothetical protein
VKKILKSSNEPQETVLSAPIQTTKEAGRGVEKGKGKRGDSSYITPISIDIGSRITQIIRIAYFPCLYGIQMGVMGT